MTELDAATRHSDAKKVLQGAHSPLGVVHTYRLGDVALQVHGFLSDTEQREAIQALAALLKTQSRDTFQDAVKLLPGEVDFWV